jgi:phage terminase large subunit
MFVDAKIADVPARMALIRTELERRRLRSLSNLAPAYQAFRQPSRYKGSRGGRGSAKSHTFGELLLSRCMNKRTRAVCVREFQVSLEQSVKRLLEDKIKYYSLERDFRVLNTHIEGPHESLIIFQGMNNHTAVSIKSLEAYDIAWFEEAQTASENSIELLRPTIRTPGSELWFSWNPQHATDPVDALLCGPNPAPNSIVVRTTWRDNPYFPEVLRAEMEWDQSRDRDKYEHVWEGEYEKHSEARVFKNWREEEFETPDDVAFLQGADWGYSVDPSVLVRCFLKGRTLYIDREAYQIGCEIDHLATLFDMVPRAREWETVADSARPETISYLKRNGYPRIVPAKKGKDSVKEGIIFLQGFDIIVHPRCKHTIDELRSYSYVRDRQTQVITPILEDKKNHVIDSLRYAVEKVRKPDEWFVL